MGLSQIQQARIRRVEFDQWVAAATGPNPNIKIRISISAGGGQAPNIINKKAEEVIISNLASIISTATIEADDAVNQILTDNAALINALKAELDAIP